VEVCEETESASFGENINSIGFIQVNRMHVQ